MTISISSTDPAAWIHLRMQRAFVTREPPAPKVRVRSLRRGGAAGLAALLGLSGLALAELPWRAPAPTATAAPRPNVLQSEAPQPKPPSPGPVWSEVANPFTAYDLAGGPYARLPLAYAARRDHAGEAREDVLTYGAAVPGAAFLRVAFRRHGLGEVVATSVFVDAARLAAGAGLAVTRSGLGIRLDTRFGPFDVAGVAVEQGGRAAQCQAFRLADPAAAPVLAITGLACGTAEHPIDTVTLACTIDRLDLVSAGDDEALRAIFVAAERRRRDGCANRPAVPLRFGAVEGGSGNGRLFRGPI